MKQFEGVVVNQGIAYAKVYKLTSRFDDIMSYASEIDQQMVLEKALIKSTKRLEEQVNQANMRYNESISVIFEAHRLMASDPIIIDRAKALISEKHSAYDSYRQATDEIIQQFEVMDNEYMRNRIVDIEDATDRVLSAIQDTEYEIKLHFSSPRVLIVDKMKPSVLFNCDKASIAGIVSATGSYNQHSGTIVRIKDIPTMIVANITKLVTDHDFMLLDGDKGQIFVNPSTEFVNQLMKERR